MEKLIYFCIHSEQFKNPFYVLNSIKRYVYKHVVWVINACNRWNSRQKESSAYKRILMLSIFVPYNFLLILDVRYDNPQKDYV